MRNTAFLMNPKNNGSPGPKKASSIGSKKIDLFSGYSFAILLAQHLHSFLYAKSEYFLKILLAALCLRATSL